MRSFLTIVGILLFLWKASLIASDTLHLSVFTDLPPVNVNNFCIIEGDKAIAAGKRRIVYFDGEKWSNFNPPIPEKVLISKIKAFSLKNIWVFYRKREYYYHHDCYHFDGEKWKKILLPQPFHLKVFSFLDSLRFFAGGGWGSFIFYDGKKAKNIHIPLDVHISDIAPFTANHAYVLAKIKEPPHEIKTLYEYKDKRWNKLITTQKSFRYIKFYNPDSGYIFTDNKACYVYSNGRIRLLKSKNKRERKLRYYHLYYNNNYIWDADTIWLINSDGATPVYKFTKTVYIYPLKNKQFLLLAGNQHIYYLGRKKISRTNNIKFQLFRMKKIRGNFFKEPGGTIGVAIYKDRFGKKNLYFTKDEDLNDFFVFNSYPPENKIMKRHLTARVVKNKKMQLWDSGVFFGDMDNDGDEDAIMTFLRGSSYLFENMGNDRFENVTKDYDFHLAGRISNAIWCDINRDGYLDLIAGDKLGELHIQVNNSFGKFVEVRAKTGIPDSLKGYNPAVADVDNDGDLDLFLYAINNPIHYFENSGLDLHTGLPKFINKDTLSPQLTTRFDFFTHSMRFADYDNDGDLDLFIANRVSPSKLFENNGHGKFLDVSAEKGFNQRMMAYGANWGDLNLDGYQDIFVTTMGKNYIFWNQEGKTFKIDSMAIPMNNLAYSIGSVLTDLDNDGDLDIIVANYKFGRNMIYENMINTKNFLKISLQCRKSNRDGIGSRIYLYNTGHLGEPTHFIGCREITTNTGYASSKLPVAHFGFKNGNKFDVLIKFPSGITKKWFGLESGQSYILHESNKKSIFSVSILHTMAGFVMNPKSRKIFLRIFYFVFLLIAFNYIIYKSTFWEYSNYFFYNLLMLFALSYLFFLLKKSMQVYFEMLIYITPLLLGAALYFLLNKSQKLRFSEGDQWQLFDLIRQLNHTHSGIKQINHLIFFLNNIQENKEIIGDFRKEFNYFKKNSFLFLDRIQNLTAQWDFSLAQKSNINSLKKYFSKLRLNTKNLSNEHKLSKIRNNLIQLKKGFELIRKHVYDFYSCDLFDVVNEVVNEFRDFSNYSIIKPSNITTMQVLILKQALVQVLENVIQNALDAIRDCPEKKLLIEMQTADTNHFRILITNRGELIRSEIQARIFNEYFSTKHSSGLGLFHAKKLLEKYNGQITLLNSDADNGTTFEIKLRKYLND